MSLIIVNHQVKDFSQWKPYFDADQPRRAEAGLKDLHLGTREGNPNDVFIIMEASDLRKVQEFISSPKLEQVMKDAGVISKPAVTILEKA